MKELVIKAFVGGHDINVIKGATFDPTIRKFRGGEKVLTIPFAGQMLSTKVEQVEAEPVIINGVEIPTKTPQVFTAVDPIPEDVDFAIVSAMFVAAVKATGGDTSKLLTMDGTVVDDDGRVIGVTGLNRN